MTTQDELAGYLVWASQQPDVDDNSMKEQL